MWTEQNERIVELGDINARLGKVKVEEVNG
jgi:hypothetical protein